MQLIIGALTWRYANRLAVARDAVLPVAAKVSNQPRDLRLPGAIAQLEEHLLCKHPSASDAANTRLTWSEAFGSYQEPQNPMVNWRSSGFRHARTRCRCVSLARDTP